MFSMLKIYVIIFLAITGYDPRPQREDFLDNCEWCIDKRKYTEPLDIGEWYIKCKRVAKPIWFDHKLLGRTHGVGKQLETDGWLYTKKYNWVYIIQSHPNHFYIYQRGWVYINTGMLYDYKTKSWLMIYYTH